MTKRNLIIIICVMVVITIIFVIVFTNNNSQTVDFSQIKKTINQQISFPVLSSDSKSLIYFSKDKKIFIKRNLTTNKEVVILNKNIFNLDNIFYSPDRSQAIVKVIYQKDLFSRYSEFYINNIPDQSIITFYIDFKSGNIVKLSDGIKNLAWFPNGSKIIYYYQDNTQSNISISKPNGSDWQKVKNLSPSEGWNFIYQSDSAVYYSRQLSEIGGTNLLRLDLTKRQEGTIINDESYINGKISPDGRNIIYLKFNSKNNNGSLYLRDLQNGQEKNLEIFTSLDRLIWSSDSQQIICAVNENEKDKFTIYNIQNQKIKEVILKNENKLNIQNLLISKDSQTIYYTANNYLYSYQFGK